MTCTGCRQVTVKVTNVTLEAVTYKALTYSCQPVNEFTGELAQHDR